MLAPVNNPLVQLWFDWYCRFALRKHFHRVHLYGEVRFDPNISTIYAANHSSFWDPIAVNYLIRYHRRQRAYCLADLVEVKKHPFFRRVGAISVDRGNARDGMRAIGFSASLLNTGPCGLVIFPQGKIEPVSSGPLRLQRGIERIMELAPRAQLVLVALRYEFWADQRPELLIDLSSCPARGVAGIAEQLRDRLELLNAASRAREPGSRVLLTGRTAISSMFG